jgi:hypothetical protein
MGKEQICLLQLHLIHLYCATNKDMNHSVYIAPENDQLTIDNVRSDMDSEFSAIEKRRKKTKFQKRAIIQD